MGDVKLNGHVIVEYPQLGKYTVIFREGGLQNFCQKFDDLPTKLKQTVTRGKANGTVKSFVATSKECVTFDPADAQGAQGFVVNIYSDMF